MLTISKLPGNCRRLQYATWILVSTCWLTTVAGCGGDLGRVSGVVTLDGKPLPEATVEFQPKLGSPSYGETDRNGRYELLYTPDRPGAEIGEHQVRISTYKVIPDGDDRIELPEKIPASYNENSKVVREVVPGRQTIDFRIETKTSKPSPKDRKAAAAH
jgi:hypothetical protein